MRFVDAGPARAALDAGQPIIVVGSHNGNWEWTLHALSIDMGCPIDAAYKPMHGPRGDRILLAIRSRFGARMIPAKRLMFRVLRDRRQARIVAIIADQDPVSASLRNFTDFFGRDTAFYGGPEAIARAGPMAVSPGRAPRVPRSLQRDVRTARRGAETAQASGS